MNRQDRIYVAGHTGLVGSGIVNELKRQGYNNLILYTHDQLDLTVQSEVEDFFEREKPDYVIVAAGLVGGIKANSEKPADFYYVNMQIANNVIWASFKSKVKKLLYLGSACMYPRECEQPMKEEMILSGYPEITNEGYALAKIAGSRLCSYLYRQYGVDYISAIPANAYGIGDCFDPDKSHVIPALIMKYQKAKDCNADKVVLWGTGSAKREFINTRDIASASLFLMNYYSGEEPINIGTGEEVTIKELSETVRQVVGFEGKIECDPSKPDGMPRRILDSTRMHNLGWKASISLREGLEELYRDYMKQKDG
ncbi:MULTISPECIES: GDP-L-fucose synthase family protein [Bacteria]|jgi:GDP-L-fucose synthase|uniref:GDP-L-fucose synthase family protein n=1 Tax=Bacteria TaxID=2 RepID=UPI00082FC2EC|nr:MULTISPECIES: GDP-L-fucose synthase [Bacteria]